MLKVLMITLLSRVLLADVDAQIEAIQHASIEERFKLMNAFKQEIVKMREAERMKAIEQLQIVTKNPNTQKVIQEIQAAQIDKEDIVTHQDSILSVENKPESEISEIQESEVSHQQEEQIQEESEVVVSEEVVEDVSTEETFENEIEHERGEKDDDE